MSTEAAILERRAIQYRDYPEEKKAEALLAYEANSFNVSQTARQLGIPRQTLDYWIKDAERFAEIQKGKRGILADRLENIAYSLVDSIDSHDLSIVPLQNKATSLAIAIDKMQLLRGQPTSISQSVISEEERQVKMAEIFSRLEARAIEAQTEPVSPVAQIEE